ncbi:CRP-like cAMP-binding protein [Wenyingzhuangia heitensis]|uniref:CRP-like cAMP-binding protein n=1 Tax=Wenyingzhuangia heitensis TaxID=1487859 RepID=A0ABX0UA96_9FLAO|nr:Crp/Fnr family transcriptional regulator [Wenyingzhuangia heitensis]NIJ44740.1 CRP-like cAMP-binding protein [Wenyingzhuangia heitensis]
MLKKESKVHTIFKNVSFSTDEVAKIEAHFHRVCYRKGDVLLRAKDVVSDQYYVETGCLRVFYSDDSGREHTVQFAIEDWWLSDYTAFFTSDPSIMTIECIQSAVLYRVSKEDLDQLYVEIPQLERFYRKKLEIAYSVLQKRILGCLYKTTKEKYLDFTLLYPNVEKCVKNYHIASYLGVTTETLSRIRKEIAQG